MVCLVSLPLDPRPFSGPGLIGLVVLAVNGLQVMRSTFRDALLRDCADLTSEILRLFSNLDDLLEANMRLYSSLTYLQEQHPVIERFVSVLYFLVCHPRPRRPSERSLSNRWCAPIGLVSSFQAHT